MILGIDASNLRRGGGVTHLMELLRVGDPPAHSFTRVLVWGGRATLGEIADRSWLVKCHVPALDRGLLHRVFWQRFRLATEVGKSGCDLLFVPGGALAGNFHPSVTMSRNLLPFQWRELRRFGWSWMTLKLLLLRFVQSGSFRKADAVIFLTRYARNAVMQTVRMPAGKTVIVPHGLDGRFIREPRTQREIGQYSLEHPFSILYVSIVDLYKHQWNVAEAVASLRAAGIPVVLRLVGPANPPALKRLRMTLDNIDSEGKFIHYAGEVSYGELPVEYRKADLCVFASSCENMPNILLEGMGSGLPMACSNRGPMPEILGEAGVYFDPEKPADIMRSLKELIDSPQLRTSKAKLSHDAAREYSWERCAAETFGFLASVAANFHLTRNGRQSHV